MAISFDASSWPSSSGSWTTNTFSHTCSWSNRILFVVSSHHNTTPAVTTTWITYAGVSMTHIATYQNANAKFNLYYLIAPATWANNVVITLSWSDASIWMATSYTWVSQTWQPDASWTWWPTTTTSYSQSVTTIADNCWSIMVWWAYSWAALTAWANTVIRKQPEVSLTGTFIVDSWTAKTPAWSMTLAVTSSNQSFVTIMASFKPAVASTTNPSFFLQLI